MKSSQRPPRDCRAAAARCVAAVQAGQSLTAALQNAEAQVEPRDRGLLRELCYGSLRWHPQLDALCGKLISQPLKSRDADLRALLAVGAYQLLHMGMPPHAAVNSAVDATRTLGKAWARGLVNAVLRRLQRESEQLLADLPEAARHAHPEWLWRQLRESWGEPALPAIAAANNSRPPMTLRVNARHHHRDEYRALLSTAGIEARLCTSAPDGLQLEQPVAVEQLPGFAQGWVSVQDEAAQRVAELLPELAPGMRILDACAAPGGKAAHLLERQPGLELTALDIDTDRLSRVADTLQRLQLKADLVAGDATEPQAWWDGAVYDAILVDAPCSGSGVIRRHPDIKLLRKASDIAALAQRQLALLQALWPLLRPGGCLVYTTCSVFPMENQEVAADFARWAAADAIVWPAFPDSGDLPWARTEPSSAGQATVIGYQQLPVIDGPDGFFYARWKKRWKKGAA